MKLKDFLNYETPAGSKGNLANLESLGKLLMGGLATWIALGGGRFAASKLERYIKIPGLDLDMRNPETKPTSVWKDV